MNLDALVKSSAMPFYGIIMGNNLQRSYSEASNINLPVLRQAGLRFYCMGGGGFNLPSQFG